MSVQWRFHHWIADSNADCCYYLILIKRVSLDIGNFQYIFKILLSINTNSKINRCIKMFAKLIINLYIGIIIKNLVFFSLLIRLRLKYTNQAITKLWPYQNWRFCFGNFSYILRECSLKSSSNIGREVEISPFS